MMSSREWFSASSHHPGRRSADTVEAYGLQVPTIHEKAIVDQPAEIGWGTEILAYAHVMAHAIIGQSCKIGAQVQIATGVIIGNHVELDTGCQIESGVIIEDEVYCGASTIIAPLKHLRAGRHNVSSLQPSLIKRGAIIAPNTTIASGFIIGRDAFVESGTVVDQNVPSYAIVRGNPFTIIGWRCGCGNLLNFIFEQTGCSACNQRYRQRSERVVEKI